jgi:hypothetical protein
MPILSVSQTLVIAFWQKNHSHENLAAFEHDVGQMLEAVGNISRPVSGDGVPCRVFQVEDPPQRVFLMLARLTKPEGANQVSKRLKKQWMQEQPGLSRLFHLGNGYQDAMNFNEIKGIRSPRVYSAAFHDLEAKLTKVLRARVKLHPEEEIHVHNVVAYLSRRIMR